MFHVANVYYLFGYLAQVVFTCDHGVHHQSHWTTDFVFLKHVVSKLDVVWCSVVAKKILNNILECLHAIFSGPTSRSSNCLSLIICLICEATKLPSLILESVILWNIVQKFWKTSPSLIFVGTEFLISLIFV